MARTCNEAENWTALQKQRHAQREGRQDLQDSRHVFCPLLWECSQAACEPIAISRQFPGGRSLEPIQARNGRRFLPHPTHLIGATKKAFALSPIGRLRVPIRGRRRQRLLASLSRGKSSCARNDPLLGLASVLVLEVFILKSECLRVRDRIVGWQLGRVSENSKTPDKTPGGLGFYGDRRRPAARPRPTESHSLVCQGVLAARSAVGYSRVSRIDE